MSLTTTRPPDDRRSLNRGAPDRSVAQRFEALEKANAVRTANARLKRDLKAGRRDIRTVLNAPPEHAGSLKAFDLLLAAPKVGRVKANRILGQAQVSPSKRLGAMTARQRAALDELLVRRLAPQRLAPPSVEVASHV